VPDAIAERERISRILASAVEEVLEAMFFTGVMGPAEAAGEDGLAALVTFRGAPSGICGVWVSRTQAREMAASFLGVEAEQLSHCEVDQVVCEFANMICGSVASRLETEERIDLDSPRMVSGEEFLRQAGDGGRAEWFEMEHGTLGLVLGSGSVM